MKRLFQLAKNIAISNFRELKFPYRLTYILTYKCQFKCNMCNIWQRSASGELSLEQIERFFKNSNGFSWINLSGGEISLRQDLLDILAVMFRECRHLYLLDFPTNGFQSKTIEDIVKKILALYKPAKLLVTVSMDGPGALHDEIRNVPGSWNKAVETFQQLRLLRTNNFNVFFGMTLQPSNMDRFEETFTSIDKQIGGLKYEDFHINLVQCSRHYYGNTDAAGSIDKQELLSQMDKIIKFRKMPLLNPIGFLERRYQYLAKIYLDKKITPVSCQALAASFFMDPAGNVYPCSIYDRAIGNIADYDYSIYKLWEAAPRRKLREEIRKGECPQCWTPCEAYQSILANLLPKFSPRPKCLEAE